MKHVHIWACPGLHNKSKKEPIWLCLHPDCNARLTKRSLTGKRTVCTKCRVEEALLDPENLKRAYPLCINCANSKTAVEARKLKDAAQDLFHDIFKEAQVPDVIPDV